jgi:secernin
MCDTLCVVGDGRTLFGKNSDRPRAEAQVLEAHAARPAGGTLRTTYLEIDDTGAHALLGSRPAWMWGFEHGVNEHRVAIGNERVYTTADPKAVPPALTGMDLVRLGLERGATADEALDVITALIAAHGQGGSGEEGTDEPYWSSFLVADPNGAWVLETSERTWVARRVDDGAAISNRVSLGVEWDRSSSDVVPGTDVATWLDPVIPTAASDVRLEATRACVATGAAALGASDIVATLRHHGTRPWGAPGTDGAVEPPPPPDAPGWTGFTVCWHLRGILSTTASIVAELPADPGTAMRVWAALGSPCASVYVPVEVTPDGAPAAMSDPATWARFAALRDRVEDDSSALDGVRAVLGPVEDALWADPGAASDGWPVVDAALARLGV